MKTTTPLLLAAGLMFFTVGPVFAEDPPTTKEEQKQEKGKRPRKQRRFPGTIIRFRRLIQQPESHQLIPIMMMESPLHRILLSNGEIRF
jgi:hypothetical protein